LAVQQVLERLVLADDDRAHLLADAVEGLVQPRHLRAHLARVVGAACDLS
jgi:hypothetical protein